jgi:hypothetical protein
MELDGFRRAYGVELLYAIAPTIRKPQLLRALAKRCPAVEPLDRNRQEGLLAFVHPDHMIELKDATIPAQITVSPLERAPSGEAIESALQQSWDFPQARNVVAQCSAAVLVTDLMSSGLPYQERLDLFSRSLLAVLEVAPPEAIHWVPTQRVVNPLAFRRAADRSASARFFAGAVNVRIFNVGGAEGIMLMDTLGLAALGLPDLQCHFRTLDPNDVVPLLYDLALYIFERGDVFDNGHTVDGVAGVRWRVQHENSLSKPDRVVLDIDPGIQYAAGRP